VYNLLLESGIRGKNQSTAIWKSDRKKHTHILKSIRKQSKYNDSGIFMKKKKLNDCNKII